MVRLGLFPVPPSYEVGSSVLESVVYDLWCFPVVLLLLSVVPVEERFLSSPPWTLWELHWFVATGWWLFSPRPAPEEDPLEYWVLLQVQDGVLSWWDFGTGCGCCGGGGSWSHQRGPVIFPDLAGGALGPPNLGL